MAKYSGKHVCVTDSMSNKKHVILVFKILTFANEALTGLPIYVSDLLALGWFELIHIKHILLKVIAKHWIANVRWICTGTPYILLPIAISCPASNSSVMNALSSNLF